MAFKSILTTSIRTLNVKSVFKDHLSQTISKLKTSTDPVKQVLVFSDPVKNIFYSQIWLSEIFIIQLIIQSYISKG